MQYLDREGNYHSLPEGYEIREREGVYGVCVRDGKILLIQSEVDDRWEVPGGGVKKGETQEEALRREYLEETGYEIVSYNKDQVANQTRDIYNSVKDVFRRQTFTYFLVSELGRKREEAIIRESAQKGDNITEITWVSLEDLSKDNFHAVHFPVIIQILREHYDFS